MHRLRPAGVDRPLPMPARCLPSLLLSSPHSQSATASYILFWSVEVAIPSSSADPNWWTVRTKLECIVGQARHWELGCAGRGERRGEERRERRDEEGGEVGERRAWREERRNAGERVERLEEETRDERWERRERNGRCETGDGTLWRDSRGERGGGRWEGGVERGGALTPPRGSARRRTENFQQREGMRRRGGGEDSARIAALKAEDGTSPA